jgi:hypothetical protein
MKIRQKQSIIKMRRKKKQMLALYFQKVLLYRKIASYSLVSASPSAKS